MTRNIYPPIQRNFPEDFDLHFKVTFPDFRYHTLSSYSDPFVVNKVAVEQEVSIRALRVFLPNIPPVLHTPTHSPNIDAMSSISVFPQRCFAEPRGSLKCKQSFRKKTSFQYTTIIISFILNNLYFYLTMNNSFKNYLIGSNIRIAYVAFMFLSCNTTILDTAGCATQKLPCFSTYA
jgi:hypothetical protein